MTDAAVLEDLCKVVDDRVRPAGDQDSIEGVRPSYCATPSSTEETAELLRVAAQHSLHVVAKGAGTK